MIDDHAAILTKLANLFSLVHIQRNICLLLESHPHRIITSQESAMLREMIRYLCKEIRKDVVPLVDGIYSNLSFPSSVALVILFD